MTTGKSGRLLKCWRHFVSGVTGIRYTPPTSLLSRETDSSTQGKKTGNRDHVCTVVQLNTSLWTVARWSVWQRGRSTLARKGYVSIALVPDTEQQSVVSREVAKSVMVDITRQYVTKNIHSCC